MRTKATFLKTRVARRILILFVLCALLPIAALAVVSYRTVASQLNEQSRQRLQDASRAMGMSIHERLRFLDAEISNIASTLTEQNVESFAPTEEMQTALSRPLRGLAVARRGRPLVPLFGSVTDPPDLATAEIEHLGLGRSLVTVQDSTQRPRVLVAKAVDASDPTRRVIWADVDPTYLWSGGDPEATLPAGMEICVVTQSLVALDCSIPFEGALVERFTVGLPTTHAGQLEWRGESEEYLSGYWTASLHFYSPQSQGNRDSGSAPRWTVLLSESKATVLQPMAKFSRTFPYIILLALWIVLLVSNIQIRKSMDPLLELRAGTKRVAQRDFSHPVQVTSGDEFEDLAASFNTMAGRLRSQFSALTAISEIDRAVLSALDTEVIVDTVVSRAQDVLRCDGITVGVAQKQGPEAPWSFVTVESEQSSRIVKPLKLTGSEQQELQDNPDHFMINGEGRPRSYLDVAPFPGHKLTTHLVLPVFLKEELAGVIALGYAEQPEIGQDDLGHVRQLADQVAVALSNTRLIEQLDRLNWGALTALARTIDAKSPWTAGHSERVTAVAFAIGRQMQLPPEELDIIHRGGLLHDIGKIGIPAEILDKPGRLTEEEFAVMRSHPEVGARILAPVEAYADVIPIVLYHHEKVDGTGYPHGLKGNDIPFLARLLAVADVFDAISSDRPYRPGWPLRKAVGLIEQDAGSHFDPDCARAFVEMMLELDLDSTNYAAIAANASAQLEIVGERSIHVGEQDQYALNGAA